VGERLPRWPECHLPKWTEGLEKEDVEKELLSYIERVVNRYKDNSFVLYWQVENEPYFSSFVKCPFFSEELFKKEIELIRQIDPQRKILVTDTGEWSLWFKASKNADILGSTLYRSAATPFLENFSYFFIPPIFYTLKARLVQNFTPVSQVIISELQMEPWAPASKSLVEVDFSSQTKYFTPFDLEKNFNYALKTGITDIYMWGAEWWYYRKLNGDASFWDEAKKIIEKYR
jgi:GH35 family endo-1,4-beta-xylanase